MTQNELVLAMLRDRGTAGVTPMDALRPVDRGGAGCFRLAARIKDLKNEGHDIRTVMHDPVTGDYLGYARYVLVEHRPARYDGEQMLLEAAS